MSLELRIGLVAVVGVIALYFGLGSLLPTTWQVESTGFVPAPPARVVPMLADFGSWKDWSTIAGTERTDTRIEIYWDTDRSRPGREYRTVINAPDHVLTATKRSTSPSRSMSIQEV